ncbi:hypothetical protein BB8028_0003g16010 [Beauveria bassiana]|uniref:Uncharacterized protein n=1 Tax=Beauveria bassiana TaxID=176275 RepID=A0A2S7YA11_BEABA|nr:hypothetical protein BB8028_0003g16010 [Beauveria bassiana]
MLPPTVSQAVADVAHAVASLNRNARAGASVVINLLDRVLARLLLWPPDDLCHIFDYIRTPGQKLVLESARQNVLASNDADGHTTDVRDCDSSHDADSGSSSDSDGGSDVDAENDYSDDSSSSDTGGKASGRSKKRGTARSPSVASSNNVHADNSPDDNAGENRPRLHKRQRVAHNEGGITPIRRQNFMPRSRGRLSQSPRRAQSSSILSPPAPHNLSKTESNKVSDYNKASAPSFRSLHINYSSNKRRRIPIANSERGDHKD